MPRHVVGDTAAGEESGSNVTRALNSAHLRPHMRRGKANVKKHNTLETTQVIVKQAMIQ